MNETFSDQELLRAIATGDRDALGQLYDRYERQVFSLAYRVINDLQVAEEIVQDVFTRVWQKGHLYDASQSKFSTWLLQVTRNRAIDILKHRRRRQQETIQEDERLSTVADQSPQTEEQVLQQMESQEIRQSMNELKPEHRNVIEWMYFQGLTQSEIADRFGIPLGTVKSRARLALNHLKDKLTRERKGEQVNEQHAQSSL